MLFSFRCPFFLTSNLATKKKKKRKKKETKKCALISRAIALHNVTSCDGSSWMLLSEEGELRESLKGNRKLPVEETAARPATEALPTLFWRCSPIQQHQQKQQEDPVSALYIKHRARTTAKEANREAQRGKLSPSSALVPYVHVACCNMMGQRGSRVEASSSLGTAYSRRHSRGPSGRWFPSYVSWRHRDLLPIRLIHPLLTSVSGERIKKKEKK